MRDRADVIRKENVIALSADPESSGTAATFPGRLRAFKRHSNHMTTNGVLPALSIENVQTLCAISILVTNYWTNPCYTYAYESRCRIPTAKYFRYVALQIFAMNIQSVFKDNSRILCRSPKNRKLQLRSKNTSHYCKNPHWTKGSAFTVFTVQNGTKLLKKFHDNAESCLRKFKRHDKSLGRPNWRKTTISVPQDVTKPFWLTWR